MASTNLRNGKRAACNHRVTGCTREVAKHERSVRDARGVPESSTSFLNALQTPQVLS